MGSASIVNMRGKPLVVTNIHVISANTQMTFEGLDSSLLRPEKLAVSPTADLAIATQSKVTGGIPMLEDVDKNVQIGDAVIVLGNSLGSSVFTEIKGTVTGIGPDLIETDAKFVEGNSGSPIIHQKTGKVIAVATFATIRTASRVSKDSQFSTIRRFGYRLDTANFTEYPSWDQVAQQGLEVQRIDERSEYLVGLFRELFGSNVNVSAHQGANDPLRNTVLDYVQHVTNRNAHPTDIIAAKQRLLRSVISLADEGCNEDDYRGYIGFHRKQIHNEAAFRKKVHEAFTELLNIQDAEERITVWR